MSGRADALFARFFAGRLAPLFSAVPVVCLLSGTAIARLTPDDIVSISKTGYITLTGEQEGVYPAKKYLIEL